MTTARITRDISYGESHALHDLAALLTPETSSPLRRASAETLARLGSSEALALLFDILTSASAQGDTASFSIRDDLLAALPHLKNPEAAPVLSAALLLATDRTVVATLRDTLARIADAAGTLEIVRAIAETAGDPLPQNRLKGALLRVRSPEAVLVLREIMLRAPDSALQAQAALALGHIATPAATAALRSALADSHSTAFTEVVAEALTLAAP